MGERRESIGELISQLASQSATLVRDEVALAKREVAEKAISVSADVAIIAAGAVIGFVAILALCASLIIALSSYIGAWQAALAIAGALVLVSVILVVAGYKRLKREDLKPAQTIESLEENKEWLKRLT
jgi:hypothetical protein